MRGKVNNNNERYLENENNNQLYIFKLLIYLSAI